MQTHNDRSLMKTLKLLPLLWLLGGCTAALPTLPALSGLMPPSERNQIQTSTSVNLSKKNFKLIKANVSGQSVGFSLLGLFTLKAAEYEEAITQLYRSAGFSEGKPQALVNVMHQQTSTYFILFSLPKITVRADIIEFTDPLGTNDTSNQAILP